MKEASHKRTNTALFHLCEISRTDKPVQTEADEWLPRAWTGGSGVGGKWRVTANGYKVSFCNYENVLILV